MWKKQIPKFDERNEKKIFINNRRNDIEVRNQKSKGKKQNEKKYQMRSFQYHLKKNHPLCYCAICPAALYTNRKKNLSAR